MTKSVLLMITCPEKTDTTSKNMFYTGHNVKGLLKRLIVKALCKKALRKKLFKKSSL